MIRDRTFVTLTIDILRILTVYLFVGLVDRLCPHNNGRAINLDAPRLKIRHIWCMVFVAKLRFVAFFRHK